MKKNIFIIAALLVLVVGCSRHLDSSDPVRTLPEFNESVSDVRLFLDNGAIHLTWNYTGDISPAGYNLYVYDNAYATNPDVEPVKDYSTALSEITISDLIVNAQYYFSIVPQFAGNILGLPSDPIPGRLTYFDMSINNNLDYLSSQSSTVRINTPLSATHMKISENPLFTGVSYIQFSPTSSFELSDGDGQKVVYASLLFADGSELLTPISDSVILDTKAKITVFGIIAPDTILTGDTILFNIYGGVGEAGASASVRFGSVSRLDLNDDGVWPDTQANDNVFNGHYIVPVNFSLNAVTVTGNFTDEAGNRDELIADELLTVFSLPQPVNLSASALSSFEVSLSWTSSSATDFLAYRIYRSTSESVTTEDDLVSSISSIGTDSFTDSDLQDNLDYYYKVFVVSTAGFTSESNEVEVTTYLNQPPAPVDLSVSLAVDGSAVFSWTLSNETDFDHYELQRSSSSNMASPTSVAIINNQNQGSQTSYLPDTNVYYFHILVIDRHGWSISSNIVSINR